VGRPSKSLEDLLRDGTFRSRRHHELLGGDDVRWKSIAKLQARYRDSDHELEKRRIGVLVENEIPKLHARQERFRKDLREHLDALGPPGSVERLAGVARKFCRLESGKPFTLQRWQLEVFRRFLRRDARGRRVFRVLLLGIPRGNGKTPLVTLAALVGLLEHDLYDSKDVFQIAGSKEQARIGLDFASGWVYDGDLKEWVQVKRELQCASSGGRMRVLSSDGRLAHGRKFRRGSADEMWLYTTYREVQSWVALETALHKDPEADLLGMTTAGHDLTSFLGEKYTDALELEHVEISKDGCLTIAEDPENGFLMVWYGAPEDADIENPAVVRACNPLSTLDVELIQQELHRPGADEHEWRRLHLNQWTKVKTAWLPTGAWRRLLDDVKVPVGGGIFVAIDAAYSGDCTAVTYVWRDSDGRRHWRARVWSTSRKHAAHVYVDEPTLDNESLVEPYIFELAKKFRIREIVFDPEYFTNEAKHLANAGFTIAPLYPQSGDMSDAVRNARKGVLEDKVRHNGDKVLAAHVEAAERKKVYRGTKEFDAIDKPAGGAKIDAATAGVMADWRATIADSEEFFGGVAFYEPPTDDDPGFVGGVE
jgi:phage terminase large subunit-like protein